MNLVLFATAWGSAQGGINAFNYDFAQGLRAADPARRLFVTVAEPLDPAAAAQAQAQGVTLLPVPANKDGKLDAAAGVAAAQALAGAGGEETLWIGHDVTTGWAAVEAQRIQGGRLALIHHMDYTSYKNIQGGAGQETLGRHEEQVRLFKTPGAALFGVGADLAENVAKLSGRAAAGLIPGFPAEASGNSSSDRELQLVMAGRFNDATEPVKQGSLAVRAFGRAINRAAGLVPALERARLIAYGLDAAAVAAAEYEKLASAEAGRQVMVVPGGFTADPAIARGEMTRANLVLMPSFREGFGLVGWEAIGAGAPLILGRASGLYRSLQAWAPGVAPSLVNGLEFHGGPAWEEDVDALANAILDVARDIPAAKARAAALREALVARHGCRWVDMARAFLTGLGERVPAPAPAPAAVAAPLRAPAEEAAAMTTALALMAQINRGAQLDQVLLRARTPQDQRPSDRLPLENRRQEALDWADRENRWEALTTALRAVLGSA